MNQVKTKKYVVYITFLFGVAISLFVIANILQHKSPHGINQAICLYEQPEDSIEVLFLGTSHVHCDVSTAVLWESYGIPAYNYSGAEQPLWMTYHYLKEAYKTQSPKVVVLDLYGPARFKEDYQYEWADENIYGMRFSANKMVMLSVSLEPERIFEYFPSFLSSHYRYRELDEEVIHESFWLGKDKSEFKGYTPYWRKKPQKKPEISVSSEERRDGVLTEKSEAYLRKIIQLTKQHGSELLLMVSPYVETNEDRLTYLAIGDIAAQEDIVMINYDEYYEQMGLDFETDLHDESHLNYWGSIKFTHFLAGYLESFSIQADQEKECYESWDRHVEDIKEEYLQYK